MPDGPDRSRPTHPGGSRAGPADDPGVLRRRLLRSVRRFRPPWLADQEEDIVQAALMQVLRIRDNGVGGQPRVLTSPYLDRVAYGCTVDEIRRRRRRAEVTPDDEAALESEPAGQADPESRAAATQVGREIRDALGQLTASRRRAVTLHLLGHSSPAIGRLLGWSTKKTESLVYRGLADLRRRLSERGVTP